MSLAQRMDQIDLSAPRWAIASSRDIYIALACVCVLSSSLAVAQALFGWYPFPVWATATVPGLLYNPVHQGQTLAIMIIALIAQRLYWFIPFLIPGLYLAHSRGAWLALALGLFATWFRYPLVLLAFTFSLALLYTGYVSPSDSQRLEIWHAAWINLTFWGHGIGSFMYLFIGPPGAIVQPEYVHNDYLQTVFEIGVWFVIPFAILAFASTKTSARDWPIFVTFLFMACFSMPIHMPIIALVASMSLASILTRRCTYA